MPELPEVETIRIGLQKYVVGHTIQNVDVLMPKLVHGDIKHIEGAKVTGARRFGKGLVIDLDNDYCIAIHIKLTGQLVFVNDKTPEKVKVIKQSYSTLPAKSTHVIFHLDKKGTLYYNDFRQFGWIKIVKQDDLGELPFFKELGPEFPVISAKQGTLTLEMFKGIVEKRKTAIKPLIMDQKKIGGIGNIYANDALWEAKIDPKRPASSLSEAEIKTLYDAIIMVLKKGLEVGGASELSYVNALGQEGQYQKHFLAYAQDGKPCKRCDTTMIKYMLASRGTYVCPKCQK